MSEPTEVDPVELAEANLAMVRLERELVELKDGGDEESLNGCKAELREARRVYRTLRDGGAVETEGVARPETLSVKANVGDEG